MKRILLSLAVGALVAALAPSPAAGAPERSADPALWNERISIIAVRQWLEGNPTFVRLPPATREATVRKYARRIVTGEARPAELRVRLPGLKFKTPAAAKAEAPRPDRSVPRASPPGAPGTAVSGPAGSAGADRAPAVSGGERVKAASRKAAKGRGERVPGRDRGLFPYDPARLPGEPESRRLDVPGPPDARNVTIMSPGFPAWLDRALRQRTAEGGIPLDWKLFPNLKNRYGRRVTPRMFVMAVILIESRGVQRRKGRVFAASGFYGFMQLGRSYPKAARLEGEENLMAGIRHLYPSFHKVFRKDAALRKGEPAVDRLLMVGACYNRGNYSRASKMRWKELVSRTRPVPLDRRRYGGLHDNRIAVFYGLQIKGYLGLPLTAAERKWLCAFRRIDDAGAWCDRKYSEGRNALLGRCRVGR